MPGITDAERPLLEAARSAPMLSQIERWAAINSGSSNLDGLRCLAGMLADAFTDLPGNIRLINPDPVESVTPDGAIRQIQNGQHLHLSVRPEAPVQLLLTGHMDTVFPADHPFQICFWQDEDVLRGPGVADMKGGLAVMLAALRALERSSVAPAFGYDVVINSDEETGSGSSARLIVDCARGKTAALTYEPALPDGTLAGARPGSGNFSIIIGGRSAHAGRNPEDGRNAVVAAADLALRLKSAALPDLGINPARIDGGGPNNVVPAHAVLRVNLRPQTPEAERDARRLLTELTAGIARAHDVQVHVHGDFNRPPKPLDPAAERLFNLVREAGGDLGVPISWAATGGVCDGNNIAACGIPVVDTMGPRGGAIHSSDEYLISSSLEERAALSALAIKRIIDRGIV